MHRDCVSDQHEHMLMGVCAQLAERLDVHPSLVRANFILAGLLLAPVIPAAYVIAGFVLGRRRLPC